MAAATVVPHGGGLARHTHPEALRNVTHPVRVQPVLHRAVGCPRLQGKFHAEAGVEGVAVVVVFGPPLAKLHAGDERGSCVVATEPPLVVSVLPAAALLLQARAALAAVAGLPLNLPDAHPHRRPARFSTAAPEAPLTHSAVLSWTLCEVVKAAVLGGDAAHVTVARPVDAVHPPVGGGAAQLSASAALPRTAPRHRLDGAQRQQQQQQQACGLG